MPLLYRRQLMQRLAAVAAGSFVLPCVGVHARPVRPPRTEGPKVGIDPLLMDTGLGQRWHAAMMRDLGWATHWAPLESGLMLTQLEQGALDAGLFLSHPLADKLDKEGLIHHRTPLARTRVYLIGPQNDPAGIRAETDVARALHQVLAAQVAGAALWKPPPAGSALAALADRLSKGLTSTPLVRTPGMTPLSSAAEARAHKVALTATPYQLITQADWMQHVFANRTKFRIWMSRAPELMLQCDVALPFHKRHPTGQLLVSWLKGPVGQNVIKSAGPGWISMRA